MKQAESESECRGIHSTVPDAPPRGLRALWRQAVSVLADAQCAGLCPDAVFLGAVAGARTLARIGINRSRVSERSQS
eukprot:5371315-Pyramimonas_sp.AAC.1